MKTYVKLLSFTAAMSFVFVTAYSSGLLVDTEGAYWHEIAPKITLLPSGSVFQWVWIAVYALYVILITPTVANRKYRGALPLWGLVGVMNVLWCAAFFALELPLFALSVLIAEIALLCVLTDFYIRNTKYLWIAMIPILAWYIFAATLNIDALI